MGLGFDELQALVNPKFMNVYKWGIAGGSRGLTVGLHHPPRNPANSLQDAA